jgi:hypothetical protein
MTQKIGRFDQNPDEYGQGVYTVLQSIQTIEFFRRHAVTVARHWIPMQAPPALAGTGTGRPVAWRIADRLATDLVQDRQRQVDRPEVIVTL